MIARSISTALARSASPIPSPDSRTKQEHLKLILADSPRWESPAGAKCCGRNGRNLDVVSGSAGFAEAADDPDAAIAEMVQE